MAKPLKTPKSRVREARRRTGERFLGVTLSFDECLFVLHCHMAGAGDEPVPISEMVRRCESDVREVLGKPFPTSGVDPIPRLREIGFLDKVEPPDRAIPEYEAIEEHDADAKALYDGLLDWFIEHTVANNPELAALMPDDDAPEPWKRHQARRFVHDLVRERHLRCVMSEAGDEFRWEVRKPGSDPPEWKAVGLGT